MAAGSAFAIIVLMIAFSTVAIVRQLSDDSTIRSIPAMNTWDETPTPPGVEVTSLATYTFSNEELRTYQSDEWNWIGVTHGRLEPGKESDVTPGSPVANEPGSGGIGIISVEQGTLAVSVDAGAWIQRAPQEAVETFNTRKTVSLEAKETLFAPPSSLSAIWNPGTSDAIFIAGSVSTAGSTSPLNDIDTGGTQGGAKVDPNDLAIGEPLSMTIDHVSIATGAEYTYSIRSETWLLAIVSGDGLQGKKLTAGVPQGKAQVLDPSYYNLHQNGFGTYEMTNTGTESVDVYFYRVEPQLVAAPAATPTAPVDALFTQTFSNELLQEYRFEDWRWIHFSRNPIYPHSEQDSYSTLFPVAWNVVPGLNVLVVESGELIVAPEAEVLIGRGLSGAFESMPAGSAISLSAGDSLLYSTGTQGRFWNPTDTITVVVGGGGYIRPESPMFSVVPSRPEIHDRWTAGQFSQGLNVSSETWPKDVPITMTIERISISPESETLLDVGTERWVLVAVERGDLEQTNYLQGVQSGAPISVLQGEMTLQPEEGKTVRLRNVGSDDAVIYVMRIEQADSQLDEQARTASPATG
jgi:hypothetical protein